jgi:hypothetical protein
MKNKVCPQDMHKIIDGYEKVVDNLNAHVHPNDPYPAAQYMRSLIRKGAEVPSSIIPSPPNHILTIK